MIDRRRIYHKRDRLRQLRAFCCAARLESFARAAAELHVSPQAITAHVAELEREMQSTLFERSPSSVRLTCAGRTLYEQAAPLVTGMDELAHRLMHRVDRSAPRRFPIAASVAAAGFFLPSHVKRFRDRHPEVTLRVRTCLVREGIRMLRDHELELVVGAKDSCPDESVEYRQVLSYDIVLITALDHPLAGRSAVSPEEAADWPAILPVLGTHSERFERTAAERLGIAGAPAIEASGWQTIKRYVESGLGISVIPTLCLRRSDRLWVVPLREHFPSGSFGVFTQRDRPLTPIARAFLEQVAPSAPG